MKPSPGLDQIDSTTAIAGPSAATLRRPFQETLADLRRERRQQQESAVRKLEGELSHVRPRRS